MQEQFYPFPKQKALVLKVLHVRNYRKCSELEQSTKNHWSAKEDAEELFSGLQQGKMRWQKGLKEWFLFELIQIKRAHLRVNTSRQRIAFNLLKTRCWDIFFFGKNTKMTQCGLWPSSQVATYVSASTPHRDDLTNTQCITFPWALTFYHTLSWLLMDQKKNRNSGPNNNKGDPPQTGQIFPHM